ncbi:aerobic-type carbon monoxide dehydrogenase, middle subunit CoxM/CutM homologs [Longilinea arvoryzae]|uniref:Aerobic-type carbon monoxide dehydrogenase, middle subunit CoxM/CutM homologs n=1 Tax=Longilinea arvoryzae TaxID=360412 RepID=A0A0S7BAH3_9CHLR|nr:aerobic-type carbon monoxide dehydrogenase, middle subunit CoxM/CutM homologs [Longilinea arvoryzae]
MILDYHRAISIDEAVLLLQRPEVRTLPLGGGTHLSSIDEPDFEVVDLQDLNLDTVSIGDDSLTLGATLSLHKLSQLAEIPDGLREAIIHHQNYNLRQVSTIAGELIAADGRSPLCTMFLAVDALLKCYPPQLVVSLEKVLPERYSWLSGKVISEVVIPKSVRLTYDAVSRTPADNPIVCVAICQWPSGRSRIVVGGFGKAPIVVYDQPTLPEIDQIDFAIPDANDDWASSEYREAITKVLIRRVLQSLRA